MTVTMYLTLMCSGRGMCPFSKLGKLKNN